MNGLLSFDVAVAGQAGTVEYPKPQTIIAPYWADIVLKDSNGKVYYRSTTDTADLELLTAHIRAKYSTPFKFTATQAVVVTWVEVTHKEGDCYMPVSTLKLSL